MIGVRRAYFCWCSIFFSRFLFFRLLVSLLCRFGFGAGSWKAFRLFLVVRLEEEGWYIWRVSFLILFSFRNFLVRVFFFSCCRKVFSFGEGKIKMVCRSYFSLGFTFFRFRFCLEGGYE